MTEDDEEEVIEPDEDSDEFNGDATDSDQEEDDVAVRPHTRRYPAALVETVPVADLAPFKIFEPAWTQQLVTIFHSRRIKPEKMVGLQVCSRTLMPRELQASLSSGGNPNSTWMPGRQPTAHLPHWTTPCPALPDK
jgi:hypothetical protein